MPNMDELKLAVDHLEATLASNGVGEYILIFSMGEDAASLFEVKSLDFLEFSRSLIDKISNAIAEDVENSTKEQVH